MTADELLDLLTTAALIGRNERFAAQTRGEVTDMLRSRMAKQIEQAPLAADTRLTRRLYDAADDYQSESLDRVRIAAGLIWRCLSCGWDNDEHDPACDSCRVPRGQFTMLSTDTRTLIEHDRDLDLVAFLAGHGVAAASVGPDRQVEPAEHMTDCDGRHDDDECCNGCGLHVSHQPPCARK